MKPFVLLSDFAILPREAGGESTLRDFLSLARQCHTRTLVCEITREQAPDFIPPETASSPEVLLASTDVSCAADYYVAEARDIVIDGQSYQMPGDAEEMRTLLHSLRGDSQLLFRAVFEKLASLAHDPRYKVVRFPTLSLLGTDALGDPQKRQLMLDAADAWLDRNAVFEVRTAGRASIAYPSAYLLRRIGERRGCVTLSSGAQNAKMMFRGFDMACSQLHACGIGALSVPVKGGWESVPLQ